LPISDAFYPRFARSGTIPQPIRFLQANTVVFYSFNARAKAPAPAGGPTLRSVPGRVLNGGASALTIARATGIVLACFLTAAGAEDSEALWRVDFRDVGNQGGVVEGRILVQALDGGILLETRAGELHNITPDRIESLEKRDATFHPLTSEELGDQLKRELGEDFEVLITDHYVICSDTGEEYVKWCGRLLERLYAAFTKYWTRAKLDVHDAESPLPVICFAHRDDYQGFAEAEAGPEVAEAPAWYSITRNQIVIYDLTGGPTTSQRQTSADIVRRLGETPFNIATVVHEATHQLAYNCGLHVRQADTPLWFAEGLAMFFEPLDLKSRTGWQGIGKPNPFRTGRFREYITKRRSERSLDTLILNDDRFLEPDSTGDAYAEAWALTWFLLREHREGFVNYVRRIAAKRILVAVTPQDRLQDFRESFGKTPNELEREFLRYVIRRTHK